MEEINKNWIWKIFFFNTGFTSLFIWNSIISINDFSIFISKEKNILNYITVSYSLGLLFSFFLENYIFGKILIYKKIIILSSIIYGTFFSWPICLYLDFGSKNYYILAASILFFINGFVSSAFQSLSIGLASSIGFKELGYNNQGNTMAAIITNLIVLFIYLINSELKEKFIFVWIYLIITIVYIFFFFFIVKYFFNSNGIYISKKLHKKSTDLIQLEKLGKFEVNLKSIILKNLDLIFCTFFCYASTLTIFPSLYFKMNFENIKIGLPLIFLLFAIFDFLARLVPERLIFKKDKYIHISCFSRIILLILAFIFTTKNYNFISNNNTVNYIIVVFIYGIMSFTNGFLTMCIFGTSTNRFKKDDEKNFAGKTILFSLFSGIFYGTCSGLIFSK